MVGGEAREERPREADKVALVGCCKALILREVGSHSRV